MMHWNFSRFGESDEVKKNKFLKISESEQSLIVLAFRGLREGMDLSFFFLCDEVAQDNPSAKQSSHSVL